MTDKMYDVIRHPEGDKVSLFVRVKLEDGTYTMAEVAALTPDQCDELGGDLLTEGRNVRRGSLVSRAAGLV